MTVQFHFSDTSMTNNVVIKSGVWTDQAQQDWCYSLIMHALTDIAKKCARKKTNKKENKDNNQHKQTGVGFLSRQKMSQSFPLDTFGRVWGQKLTGRLWSPQDRRSRNPYKSPPTA